MNINTSKGTVRTMSLPALVVLLAIGLNAASHAVGSWNCISTKTPLGDLSWLVTIKEEGGRLSGSASCDELGTFRLHDVKLDGDAFSFVFYPSGNYVVVKTKIDRESMTGTWEMDGGSGGEFAGKKSKEEQ